MDFINVTMDNIDNEDICCANSDKKGDVCAASKKAWLKERFQDGMVFKKLNERGKVFIEYIPAENAWCPISADGYMFIDCFWVSGSFKGKGYASGLLNDCIADSKAQGKKGLVVLSAAKKMPFLSDPKFLKYKGFKVADKCEPFYELLYLPFKNTETVPAFKASVKQEVLKDKGLILYFTNHCPYNARYVPQLENIARERGVKFTAHKITSKAEAQAAPAPFTTYSLFYNGRFVTNEILSEAKFIKFLDGKGL
ncbi:MAG: acetyltransferase [Eubacterium sp.]|jgi:thiol-disulfide isomerase/thioredoxin|nr:acetyltransferase [Eubacterium sp.]